LNPTTLNMWLEGAQLEETVALCLDKLPLEQVYNLQKETQQELQYREDIVHDELHFVNEEKVHYVEMCASLKKEKE